MEEILNKLYTIADLPSHYLRISNTTNNSYLNEFFEAATIIKSLVSEKEFEFWCTEKMLLKRQPFVEKTFIQYAVETSVVRFFGERFPADFQVEAKINPTNDKDVDCRFKDAEFVFNVEVKCSNFVSKENIASHDGFKYATVGRLPSKGDEVIKVISAAIDEGLKNLGEPLKPHSISKKMDNNMKEFLKSAHEKFYSTDTDNELNVLVVGCDDPDDIQEWMNYLWAEQGLFTPRSFCEQSMYNNVDLVMLTNQYYKHNKFFEKNIKNCWTIEAGFNLIYANPYRKLKKQKAINHFLNITPHFTFELQDYNVAGNVPDILKQIVLVSHFVHNYLEKGKALYVFQEKSPC